MRYKKTIWILIVSFLIVSQTAVRAAVTPDRVLVKAVRNCRAIAPENPLHVGKQGTEVYVTTLMDPKTTEKDRKVDAVLVAKAVMDADKTVLIVHFRLKKHVADREYEAIVVKQSDVKAYGARAIDVNSLLGQLKVVKRRQIDKE